MACRFGTGTCVDRICGKMPSLARFATRGEMKRAPGARGNAAAMASALSGKAYGRGNTRTPNSSGLRSRDCSAFTGPRVRIAELFNLQPANRLKSRSNLENLTLRILVLDLFETFAHRHLAIENSLAQFFFWEVRKNPVECFAPWDGHRTTTITGHPMNGIQTKPPCGKNPPASFAETKNLQA
jgi:hypothetical protein